MAYSRSRKVSEELGWSICSTLTITALERGLKGNEERSSLDIVALRSAFCVT